MRLGSSVKSPQPKKMPHPAPKVKRSSMVLAKLVIDSRGGVNLGNGRRNMDLEQEESKGGPRKKES
jgi:hypothetical protein